MATPRRSSQNANNHNSSTNALDARHPRIAAHPQRVAHRPHDVQTYVQTPLYDDSNDDAVDPHAARRYTGEVTYDGVPLYHPAPSELGMIAQDPRDVPPGVLYAADRAWLPPDVERQPYPVFEGDSRGRSPSGRGPGVDPGGSSGNSSQQSSYSGSDDGETYRSGSDGSMTSRNTNPPPPPPPPHANALCNRQHYPAFDADARRIGMEHLRYRQGPPPGDGPSHYLERTQHYPTGSPEPQILTYDSGIVSGKRGGKKSAKRAEESQFLAIPHEPLPLDDVPDAGPDLRALLGLGEDDPVNLDVLRQPRPGEKPEYPYPLLVQIAIYGSPHKRLTLSEIYAALEEKFEWFRSGQGKSKWQGSIRHNLSLNRVFRQVSRPINYPGKGNWWVVDYSNGVGNKRERKRNRPQKKGRRQATPESDVESEPEPIRTKDIPGQTKFKTVPPYGVHGTRSVPVDYSPNSANSMVVISSSPASTSSSPGTTSPRLYDPVHSQDSRASGVSVPFDEANIDPALRASCHVVGEGRTRAHSSESVRRHRSSPYSTPINIRRSARIRQQEPQPSDELSRSQSPMTPFPDSPNAVHPQARSQAQGVAQPSSWSPSAATGSPRSQGSFSPHNALGLGFEASQGSSHSGSSQSSRASGSASQPSPRNASQQAYAPPAGSSGGRRVYAGRESYRDARHDSDDD